MIQKDNSKREDEKATISFGVANTAVMVVGNTGKPLMPTSPKRARILLKNKKADIFRTHPFTIRLFEREEGDTQPMEVKFDPGSKTTGIVLTVLGEKRGWFCVLAWELSHRGQQIRNALLSRSLLRYNRRSRKTRYRQARFLNRKKKVGWLPPSLQSRVDNITAFTKKYIHVCPLNSIVVEQVKFDLQLLENPEISGINYQQGTLLGYEIREYLLEKWNRTCVYCKATNTPLQVEHMVPKSKGGTDRISNLCLACEKCNQKKSNQNLSDFLENKPDLLKRLLSQAKLPLKDATVVNITRKTIVKALEKFGIPVLISSGGKTKYNRTQQNYPKSHWIDAACVGVSGRQVDLSKIIQVTIMQAIGRGSRQMCKPDKYGFPRTSAKKVKRFLGFQTGDLVSLNKYSGKYKGFYVGYVTIRANGQFDVKVNNRKITTSYIYCKFKKMFDGYKYSKLFI